MPESLALHCISVTEPNSCLLGRVPVRAGNTATMMRPMMGSRPVMKAQPSALRFLELAMAPATIRQISQRVSPAQRVDHGPLGPISDASH